MWHLRARCSTVWDEPNRARHLIMANGGSPPHSVSLIWGGEG